VDTDPGPLTTSKQGHPDIFSLLSTLLEREQCQAYSGDHWAIFHQLGYFWKLKGEVAQRKSSILGCF